MDQLQELCALITHHAPEGRHDCALPGVTLLRWSVTTQATQVVYDPLFCVVAQGRKTTLLGHRRFDYGGGDYLIAAVELPVTGTITQASADEPYLAFSVAIDPTMLSAVMLDMPSDAFAQPATSGLAVASLEQNLLDPVTRLLRLLDRPADIRVLAPMIMREILYRVLIGPQGPLLRQVVTADGAMGRISRAIAVIRRDYMLPLRIADIARQAGMSEASFFRHFKAVTAMSPLQFQKSIRLQEARHRLLAQHGDIAGAGFAVGYENPSQFSREYSRMFGAPPGRDAEQLRTIATPPI